MKKFWIVLGCMLLVAGCSGESGKKETKQEKDAAPVVKSEEKDDIRDVSFVAVGDNLIHGAIFYYNAKGMAPMILRIFMSIQTAIHARRISPISIRRRFAAVRSWD